MANTTGDMNLNLPDGIRVLYQRRYSAPGGHKCHEDTSVGTPIVRRHSLGSVDQCMDISPLAVRWRAEAVLSENGVTAAANRTTRHQSAGVKGRLVAAVAREQDFGSFANPIVPGEMRRKSFSSLLNQGMWRSRQLEVGGKWTSSRRAQSALALTHATRADDSDDDVAKRKKTRRQSTTWCLVPLKRPAQCAESDADSLPKCSYRLRGNGLITSELVGHIMFNDSDTSQSSDREVQGKGSNLKHVDVDNCDKRKKSLDISSEKESGLDNLQFGLRASSLTTNLPGQSPFSEAWTSEATANSSPATRRVDQLLDLFAPSPTPTPLSTSVFGRNASFSKSSSGLEGKFCATRRDSATHFEFLGTPQLHGSPQYTGRLRLVSCRAVHFRN